MEEIGGAEKNSGGGRKVRAGTTSAGFLPERGVAPTAGMPVGAPGADAGKPMDPERVAEQAQRLPLPARIALPAVLANEMHQERIEAELRINRRNNASQPVAAPETCRGPDRKTISPHHQQIWRGAVFRAFAGGEDHRA